MHGCTTWIGEVGLGHIPNPTPPPNRGTLGLLATAAKRFNQIKGALFTEHGSN